MEIVSFEGGLNTKVHPQFVQPNQATILNDGFEWDFNFQNSVSGDHYYHMDVGQDDFYSWLITNNAKTRDVLVATNI